MEAGIVAGTQLLINLIDKAIGKEKKDERKVYGGQGLLPLYHQ
jgi:hypothetical protein